MATTCIVYKGLLLLWFAAFTATHAFLPPEMQNLMGLPLLNHVEVISTQRDNVTIQAFLDEFMAEEGYQANEGRGAEMPLSNIEDMQARLCDPQSHGLYIWFHRKCWLAKDREGEDYDDDEVVFDEGEIVAKTVQFLRDGHVVFCLSVKNGFGTGDCEMKKEHEWMERVKQCVNSQLGYIGTSGSPRVDSLGEFLTRMEESAKHGHWTLRKGFCEGIEEEITARAFMGLVFQEIDEKWGTRLKDGINFGWTHEGIQVMIDGRSTFYFRFSEKTKSGDRSFISKSFEADIE